MKHGKHSLLRKIWYNNIPEQRGVEFFLKKPKPSIWKPVLILLLMISTLVIVTALTYNHEAILENILSENDHAPELQRAQDNILNIVSKLNNAEESNISLPNKM